MGNMWLFPFFCFISLILILNAASVVRLNDSSYTTYFKSHTHVVVKIGASWCNRSTHIGPQFNLAADQISTALSYVKDESKILFADIDGPTSPILISKYSIQVYPTVALFTNSGRTVQIYNGQRTASSIANWVMRSITHPIKHLVSWDAVESWSHLFSPLFVAWPASSDISMLSALDSVALNHRTDAVFVTVPNNGTNQSELRVYRQNEGFFTTLLKDTSNRTVLEDFVTKEMLPLVGVLSADTHDYYIKDGNIKKPIVWVVSSDSDLSRIGKKLQQIASTIRNNILVVHLSTDVYKEHAWSILGILKPPSLLIQLTNHSVYEYHGDLMAADSQSIITFTEQGIGKLLHEKHRSLPITNSEGAVKTLVADEFESKVLRNSKNTLIAVIAPWGINNSRLEAALQEYAKKTYENNAEIFNNMNMYIIDGTSNDVRQFAGFEIMKYPTMFYVSADYKTPIKFYGPESADAISIFIERNMAKQHHARISS